MRIDFKIALYGLLFGLGISVAGMALPMRYPNIPTLILDIMIYGGLAIAFGSFVLIIYELVIKPRLAKKTIQHTKIINLHKLFLSDFDSTKPPSNFYLTIAKGTAKSMYQTVDYILWPDFTTKTISLSIYLAKSDYTFIAFRLLIPKYSEIVQENLSSDGLTFSGQVYIYHETDLSPEQVDLLINEYKNHGLFPQFRGNDYLIQAEKQISPKLIISLHELSSLTKKGYLTYKIVFSNDTDKQCIIKSAILMTLLHDDLIKLNQYNVEEINYNNNYKNIFDNYGQMSVSPHNQPNPIFPKTLGPDDLWSYEIVEPFDPHEFVKKNGLPNIRKIPIGVSIHIIDIKGRLLTDDLGFHSEILVSNDGTNYNTSSSYIQHYMLIN